MAFLFISVEMAIAVAGNVLVAQYTGAQEEREAEYAVAKAAIAGAWSAAVPGARATSPEPPWTSAT